MNKESYWVLQFEGQQVLFTFKNGRSFYIYKAIVYGTWREL
jgi:hypothetical protein